MVQNNSNEPKVRQRVRIRFSKQGDLRLIGHRDLARLLERLFRRAGLRLGMSEGFHPKPRMSFPSALAVGVEGCEEVMELELAENWTAPALHRRLNEFALPGIAFGAVEDCPPGAAKACIRSLTYEIPLQQRLCEGLNRRISELMDSDSCPVQRAKGGKPLDLRPQLESLEFSEGILSMRIRVSDAATPAPREVLAALGLPPGEACRAGKGCGPKRKIVELQT